MRESQIKLDGMKALGYLETVGRKTGKRRETEIWFGFENDTVYLLSGGGLGKDWIRNFQKEPHVRFRVGDQWVRGIASIVDDSDLEHRMRRVVAAKYYKFDPDSDTPLPNAWSKTAAPVIVTLD